MILKKNMKRKNQKQIQAYFHLYVLANPENFY